MTQPDERETLAKVGFVAVMAMLLGGVGIVIAALSIGIERAVVGRRGGTANRWGDHLARTRAWAEADRAYRAARSAAYRKWWRDGADPAKRPPAEKGRLGKWARRAWAAVALSAAAVLATGRRFGSGAREGATRAREQQRQGGSFGQVIGAGRWGHGEAEYVGDDGGFDTPQPPPPPATPPPPAPQVVPAQRPAEPALEAPAQPQAPPPPAPPIIVLVPVPSQTTPATAETDADDRDIVDAQVVPDPERAIAPGPDATTPPAQPAQPQIEPPQEEPMTAPAGTETNLDQTIVDLGNVNAALAQISELTDALGHAKNALDGAVSAATERATATGAPAATLAALDAAQAVSATLGAAVGTVSSSAVEAGDVTDAARAGLAPAADAQDTLHAAGARGEFVSAATS